MDVNQPTGHYPVIEQFIKSVQTGEEDLIAHGAEGINGLTLANAIMLSSFNQETVFLPMDADRYENKLKELVKTSNFVKSSTSADVNEDMSGSFSKG